MASSTQDMGNTFGALLIGVVLAAVLFGLTNAQAFIYFQMRRGTKTTFFKVAVISLWILDALHLALVVHSVYYYLVANFANIDALTEVVWSFRLQIVIDVVIIYEIHVLYVYRIWIVSKGRSRGLPIIVGIVVILGLGVAISFSWGIYLCRVFTDFVENQWLVYMALGTTAFLDIAIASSLCYLLASSRTGFSSTDSLITKLMGYTIDTGCLTSVCSMTAIITCAVMPTNYIFLSVEFLLGKLYVNSFIALLNARYYLQPNADTINSSELRVRHSIYHPELHIRTSQGEGFQAPRKDVLKDPEHGMLHPTLPVQAFVVGSCITGGRFSHSSESP
ncbi:hypothetical protein DFH29DRAFT_186696 [Suillus ampliporus]|nr:hypothetical protein DFH29DRAFT_186696 [Suillus ampliporus]